MPYRLGMPADYKSTEKYPVILFLHGNGSLGTDNYRQLLDLSNSFNIAGDLLSDAIFVFPQTPTGRDLSYDKWGYWDVTKRLVDSIVSEYGGDKNRLYVLGISLGGFATWHIIEAYGDYFAAAVPICGGIGYYYCEELAETPIWTYHGTADSIVPFSSTQQTYTAIKNSGGKKIRFTEFEGVDHNAWDYALADRDMFLRLCITIRCFMNIPRLISPHIIHLYSKILSMTKHTK